MPTKAKSLKKESMLSLPWFVVISKPKGTQTIGPFKSNQLAKKWANSSDANFDEVLFDLVQRQTYTNHTQKEWALRNGFPDLPVEGESHAGTTAAG